MKGTPAKRLLHRKSTLPATAPQTVAEVLSKHVVLEVESIDRMYLNVIVGRLQILEGALRFIRQQRKAQVLSTNAVEPMTRAFVESIEQFVRANQIPLITFEKGQRKDEVAARLRAKYPHREGVIFVGKAQEKCTVYRTEKRHNPKKNTSYAWIVKSTALVNHYYFYCVDESFGPFFLKFCSYFPYNAKLCLNGHEYAKRQLDREQIPYQALDNGIRSCANPKRLQTICDSLSAEKIDTLLRKWLRRLPHPFPAQDRQAGYRYQISILQIELSLTQILDRPVSGRIFFEDVIRENLDIGRPKQIQLIFDRWVTKATHGSFRTRVITDGVIPSLHIDYKGTRIKRSSTPHRDDHQQHPRLLHRQEPAQLARVTQNRLSGQPSPFGNGEHHTRLHARRTDLPTTQSSPHRPRATRLGPALRRSDGAGHLERTAGFRSVTHWLLQSRLTKQSGCLARGARKTLHPRPDELSIAAAPASRPDRTDSQNSSLPPHNLRLPCRHLLHPHLRKDFAPRSWPGAAGKLFLPISPTAQFP